jgi:Ser/Thr protein kinase RdoA (MazF antagonist)
MAEQAVQAETIDALAGDAVRAWRRIGASSRSPQSIATLKAAGRKSAVYRLVGAGPSAEDIVAKRCSTTTAMVERAVYRDVLSRLPVSHLRCYGLVDDVAPGLSWLFVEDAGGQPFRAGIDTHRILAARWMATVHCSTEEAMLAPLPERGLAWYRDVIATAMSALIAASGNQHIEGDDRATVSRALLACRTVAERWDDVAAICDVLPETLVHGGFGRKNVHVRERASGPELLPFDWEAAGRGMPAADLARVDAAVYASTLSGRGPQVSAPRARRVVETGRALWCCSSIPGEASTLSAPWATRAMPKIRAYCDELHSALAALGWKPGRDMKASVRSTTTAAPVDGQVVPREHPAVEAWTRLHPLDPSFAGVDPLSSKEKATVWRLRRAGPDGTDVIAKIALRASASTERTIYERVLPRVSVASLTYHGHVDDGDETLWLFLGDAGDDAFHHDDEQQRALAAQWLGRLHAEGARVPEARTLPDRGAPHFRQRLNDARTTLAARLAGPVATEEEAGILAGLLDQCARLAEGWSEIETFCAGLPKTVVHGDFAALNVRMRRNAGGTTIVAFDWEKAGYAPPVIDIARGVDLETYWSVIRSAWPAVTLDDVRQMALVARVFRPLSHNWARKTPEKLADHYLHMQQTIAALGWAGPT